MDEQPQLDVANDPIAAAFDAQAKRAGSLPAACKDSATTWQKARVLVVNGLVGATELIEPYATASGITCHAFTRARSALTAMKQAAAAGHPYDVVFIERVLPDMDPGEFARAVAGDSNLAAARLILVSTFAPTGADQPQAADLYYAHLAKPYKQNQVLAAVEAAIAGATDIGDACRRSRLMPLPAEAAGRRIMLIAEDNPVMQMLVLLQLKERGLFAEVVTNGLEAVQAAQKHDFSAIFMDCQMPCLDGFQATEKIRAWENLRSLHHVPIIAMTASTAENMRDRCLQAGMNDYINKPVTHDKLEAILSRWLNYEKRSKEEGNMDKPNDLQAHDMSGKGIGKDYAAPAPGSIPVDFDMLAEMLGADEAREILGLFVASSQELLDRLGDALGRRDGSQLQEAAHTLKGASSSIGANKMWQQCIELEHAARERDWSAIPELLSSVQTSFEQAKNFIENKH